MARHDDMDLMLFHDRQLAPAEAAEVDRQLKGSADDRAKVTALGQVGEVVRTHLEIAADEAEPALDGMWGRIERALAEGGVGATEGLAAAPVAPRAAAEVGLLGAILAWFDRHRGHFVTGAVTAGAVAALFLALRPTHERVVTRTVQAPAPVEVRAASTPAEVEYLEVVDGTGTVLTLGEGEDTTTVLWIDPNDESVEGPI
jgi:hypothetical protein